MYLQNIKLIIAYKFWDTIHMIELKGSTVSRGQLART